MKVLILLTALNSITGVDGEAHNPAGNFIYPIPEAPEGLIPSNLVLELDSRQTIQWFAPVSTSNITLWQNKWPLSDTELYQTVAVLCKNPIFIAAPELQLIMS